MVWATVRLGGSLLCCSLLVTPILADQAQQLPGGQLGVGFEIIHVCWICSS